MVVSTDSHNNTDIIDQLTKQNKELLERLESVELKLKENLELELHQSKVESNDLILSLSKFEQEKKLRQENFTQALNSLRTDDNKILDTPYRKARLLLGQDEVINLQGEELKDMISGLIDKIDEQDDLITRLKFEFEVELGHSASLRSENTKLKENNCNIQRFVEQEEEFISNKLLKRISLLKKEKSDLLMKLEQEEEMITNNLQKKLQKLQKEKIDMELSLEMEQEFIVNRLQKQLKSLMDQNSSGISTPLKISIQQQSHPLHSPSSSYNDLLPSVTPSILEILRSEVATYKGKLESVEKENEETLIELKIFLEKIKIDFEKHLKSLNMPVINFEKEFEVENFYNQLQKRNDELKKLLHSANNSSNPSTNVHNIVSSPKAVSERRPSTSPVNREVLPFDDIRSLSRSSRTSFIESNTMNNRGATMGRPRSSSRSSSRNSLN